MVVEKQEKLVDNRWNRGNGWGVDSKGSEGRGGGGLIIWSNSSILDRGNEWEWDVDSKGLEEEEDG